VLVVISLRLPQWDRSVNGNWNRGFQTTLAKYLVLTKIGACERGHTAIASIRNCPYRRGGHNPPCRASLDGVCTGECWRCSSRSNPQSIVRAVGIISLSINIAYYIHHSRPRLCSNTKVLHSHILGQEKVVSDQIQRWSLCAIGHASREVLEDQIAESNGSSVWRERVLPILIHVEAVQRRLATEVLECDVGDVARATGICLDEGDVVAVDN
jgi:hypothetical protein